MEIEQTESITAMEILEEIQRLNFTETDKINELLDFINKKYLNK